jgi:two-component system chemotaxis sensor kinase CheA
MREVTTELHRLHRAFDRNLAEMQSGILEVRMVPLGQVFDKLARVVRQISRDADKQVNFVITGAETEIDKLIVEELSDPLMHMMRNAVDHGIERPDEREARGKPRAGTIRLTAAQRGSAIEIDVQDDGAGLDPARLRASAVRKGVLSDDQATALDDQAAMDLIFQPGFSTSATVTETSGRGVGLDVVRAHVERLNGHVRVSGSAGRGTRFTIGMPLTLATTRAILVKQSGQIYAIPSMMTERSARVREQQLISLEGRRAVEVEGHPVPVVELADVLERPRESTNGQDAPQWRPFFILRQDDRRVALLADGLLGEQEIVVKSLGWPLRRVRNVGGAAVLGSGQTVAILNPFDLLKTASRLAGAAGRRPDQRPAPAPTTAAAQPPAAGGSQSFLNERRRRRILVVDDSLPTRTLVRSILEAAGYATTVATDGTEALEALHGAPVDLVVSDIEMPGLDGFALTAAIRRDEKLRQIPVVLVTSLAAREHRERGVAAGADAYIVKGSFDQGQLLDTVGRLIA